MLVVPPLCQPTKPPQLVVAVVPVVSSLPSNTVPVMFSTPMFTASMPPWVPSSLTLLWMTVLTRQFSTLTVPQCWAMSPAAYLAEV